MGWASQRAIELEEQRRRAQERIPEHLDIALAEIAILQDKLLSLEGQLAAQNSFRERYKSYVVGGIVGAIISFILALLL